MLVAYRTFPTWTYVYEPNLLPGTLDRHIDFAALNASETTFAVTAVDVEAGILTRFRNHGVSHKNKDANLRNPETDEGVEIRPRHILASASLAPAFPWTEIDGRLRAAESQLVASSVKRRWFSPPPVTLQSWSGGTRRSTR